jgi:hypothetical protein
MNPRSKTRFLSLHWQARYERKYKGVHRRDSPGEIFAK